MKTLQPIYTPPQRITADFAKRILEIFQKIIYAPLDDILQEEGMQFNNSVNALNDALLTRRLIYSDGFIKGKVNAKIGKVLRGLGGTFDRQLKAYKIDQIALPSNTQMLIADIIIRDKRVVDRVLNQLSIISRDDNVAHQIVNFDFDKQYMDVIGNVDDQFSKTVTDVIEVKANLTDSMRLNIANNYSDNLKLPIKDFIDEQVPILRKVVEDNTFAGFRAERLEDIIKERFEVGFSKAKFLARQETNLLTAKYREQRYKDVGINEYIWSTSKDGRVRASHKALDQTVQSWSSPPIVDIKTGRKAHAGEDFLCRCVAKPVIT
tara:strand:- start:18956 stop:19918 length:963 start_codon:yes stop_codon:yes gene_type:complete